MSGKRQWTIKGLPVEVVELSRKAASLKGMKIAHWVAGALQDAATRNTAGISFRLQLLETTRSNKRAQLTGREVTKVFTWPALPRKGDDVVLGGNGYTVNTVEHNPSQSATPGVQVLIDAADFAAFLADSSWERKW